MVGVDLACDPGQGQPGGEGVGLEPGVRHRGGQTELGHGDSGGHVDRAAIERADRVRSIGSFDLQGPGPESGPPAPARAGPVNPSTVSTAEGPSGPGRCHRVDVGHGDDVGALACR